MSEENRGFRKNGGHHRHNSNNKPHTIYVEKKANEKEQPEPLEGGVTNKDRTDSGDYQTTDPSEINKIKQQYEEYQHGNYAHKNKQNNGVYHNNKRNNHQNNNPSTSTNKHYYDFRNTNNSARTDNNQMGGRRDHGHSRPNGRKYAERRKEKANKLSSEEIIKIFDKKRAPLPLMVELLEDKDYDKGFSVEMLKPERISKGKFILSPDFCFYYAGQPQEEAIPIWAIDNTTTDDVFKNFEFKSFSKDELKKNTNKKELTNAFDEFEREQLNDKLKGILNIKKDDQPEKQQELPTELFSMIDRKFEEELKREKPDNSEELEEGEFHLYTEEEEKEAEPLEISEDIPIKDPIIIEAPIEKPRSNSIPSNPITSNPLPDVAQKLSSMFFDNQPLDQFTSGLVNFKKHENVGLLADFNLPATSIKNPNYSQPKGTNEEPPNAAFLEIISEIEIQWKNLGHKDYLFSLFTSKLTNLNIADFHWYYRDPKGMIQGPFSSVDMDLWNNDKYFSKDLPLSWQQNQYFITTEQFKKNPAEIVKLAYARDKNVISVFKCYRPPVQNSMTGVDHINNLLHGFNNMGMEKKQEMQTQPGDINLAAMKMNQMHQYNQNYPLNQQTYSLPHPNMCVPNFIPNQGGNYPLNNIGVMGSVPYMSNPYHPMNQNYYNNHQQINQPPFPTHIQGNQQNPLMFHNVVNQNTQQHTAHHQTPVSQVSRPTPTNVYIPPTQTKVQNQQSNVAQMSSNPMEQTFILKELLGLSGSSGLFSNAPSQSRSRPQTFQPNLDNDFPSLNDACRK